MLSCRHHIHLICDFSDVALHSLQDNLRIYFESKAHLTHDLFLMRPEASAYSWQCINNCDYTLLLIGDSYGQLANTGVSQLHISYLNAKTKSKPMVAFIKKAVDSLVPTKANQQLNNFINLVNNQVDDIILYDDESDLQALIQKAHLLLQNGNEKPQAIASNDIIDITLPIYDITDEPILVSKESFIKTKPIEPLFKAPPKLTSLSNDVTIDNNIRKNLPAPKLDATLTLGCNAQAFQGGTLLEISFEIQTDWREVLVALSRLPNPFSTQGFTRAMNEIAKPKAMPAVNVHYPRVHAVSRCQVIRADIVLVQNTLTDAGWLERLEQGREMWQMTETAKRLIGYDGGNLI